VSALSAAFAIFAYVASQYGARTFGAWQDYASAIAAGALGHVIGHGLNLTQASVVRS